MIGYVVIRCLACQRVWVGRNRGMELSHGLCGAQGPDSYICRGELRIPRDEFAPVVQAAFLVGGWEALVAVVRDRPAWGWFQGGAFAPK